MPIFGAIMIKCVFGMLFLDPRKRDTASEVMNPWAGYLAIIAVGMLFAVTIKQIMFGYVGENITMNIRRDVYQSVMRKHMGWHDDRKNNSGIISAILSGDCSSL